MLNVLNDRRLEIRLGVSWSAFQAEKFEDVGLFEYVLRSGDTLTLTSKIMDRFLVATKCKPLVEACTELTFEISQCPTLFGGLDLIKSALFILKA